MIGVVDYGMGNLGSVFNACRFLDIPARIVTRPGELDDCRGMILPGQGAFRDCMGHLEEHGFVEPVKAWIAEDRPFLGICMGLQFLFAESEEAPGVAGLGLLPGRVVRFRLPPELKIPQMGWNRVRVADPACPLWHDLPGDPHFYFVHSYYVDEVEDDAIAGRTEYGVTYTSAVCRGRMFAVQFHPEKSQSAGLQLLRSFAAITDAAG